MDRRESRIPRLAVAAWAAALAAFVALAIAVTDYLGSGPSAGMTGHHHLSDAVTRAGSGPSGALLGTSLLTSWHLDAIACAVLVLAAAAYLTGVALVPLRSPGERWPLARTASFLAGLAVCAFATNGSIAVYDQALFTAHMLGEDRLYAFPAKRCLPD